MSDVRVWVVHATPLSIGSHSAQSAWVVSIDGGEPRRLIDRFAGGPAVDVSPDGKWIVLASRDQKVSVGVAVTCEYDCCLRQRVLRDLGFGRMRWTPDSRAITYVDSATPRNLWIIPADGGTPSQLTRFDERVIVDVDWSADGKRLAVARRLETNDIAMLQGLRR